MAVAPRVRQQIKDNVARVRERIGLAAERSGRSPESVTLVAVTKYVDIELTRVLAECDCQDLGESRPQQLWTKAEALAELPIRWHLIGHLQRNKLARVLPHVSLLHSLDSERLWQAIVEWCRTHQVASPQDVAPQDVAPQDVAPQDVGPQYVGPQNVAHLKLPALLEVNISGDANKHGFHAREIQRFVCDNVMRRSGPSGIEVQGLMAMASLEGGADRACDDFRALRELRDQLVIATAGVLTLPELSMGMSDDFEVAIEQGATIVRVGSLLFEGTAV